MRFTAAALMLFAWAAMVSRSQVYLEDGRPAPKNVRIAQACNGGRCETIVSLPGFETVRTMKMPVVLYRIGSSPRRHTVSLTEMMAPDSARDAFLDGISAAAENRWTEAQKHLQRALEIFPQYSAAWDLVGMVHERQGRVGDARAAYKKAAAADTQYPAPVVHLAALALGQQQWAEARNAAARAISLNAMDPVPVLYDALALFGLGRLEEAEQRSRQALDMREPSAEYLLARVLEAQGDLPGALQHLESYAEHAPKSERADLKKRIHALRGRGAEVRKN